MNNKVQEFLNDKFGEVQAININNSIWFMASDVSRVLQYDKASDMTRNLDEDEKGIQSFVTKGGKQRTLVINKKGLHKALIINRRLDLKTKGKIFNWLTHDSINKYITTSSKQSEFVKKLKETLKISIEFVKNNSSLLYDEPNFLSFKSIVKFEEEFKTDNYFIDLWFENAKLVVEYDEEYHSSQLEKDMLREKSLKKELRKMYNYSKTGWDVAIIRVKKGYEEKGIIEIMTYLNQNFGFIN